MSARIFDVITAEGTEVENTATEGAFAETIFPAGFWQVGKVVAFHGAVIVNDNNGTDTLTGRIRFGASATPASNTAVVATSAVDSADADVMIVEGQITCRAIDASAGVLVFSGTICDPDAEGQAMVSYFAVVSSLDLQSDTYLQMTGTWSAAHADNEAAAAQWNVIELAG